MSTSQRAFTENDARKLGYRVEANGQGGWYIKRGDQDITDRGGAGWPTKEEALAALVLMLRRDPLDVVADGLDEEITVGMLPVELQVMMLGQGYDAVREGRPGIGYRAFEDMGDVELRVALEAVRSAHDFLTELERSAQQIYTHRLLKATGGRS